MSPSRMNMLSVQASNDLQEEKPKCCLEELFLILTDVETNLRA